MDFWQLLLIWRGGSDEKIMDAVEMGSDKYFYYIIVRACIVGLRVARADGRRMCVV